MQTITVRGIQMRVLIEGAGAPLLFVHGHPFDHAMWAPQLAAFVGHYQVIAPDLRGYGKSDVQPGMVLLDELALDLAVLLDELGLTQVTLIGLSMGGQIALEFARLFPQRVKRLVLCATSAKAETPASYQKRIVVSEVLAAHGMAAYCAEALPNFFSAQTFSTRPDIVETVRQMILKTPKLGAAATNRGRAERRDHTAILPTLTMPSLIIVGAVDVFTPVTESQYMLERLPNAEMHVIAGVGHLPNLEAATEFNAILTRFLVKTAMN